MKKSSTYLMSLLFVVLPILSSSASAADPEKDADRLRNSGTVLKEVLDVPDDIPQDLLDKADCVVVFPSVLKAAFIVGGRSRSLKEQRHRAEGGSRCSRRHPSGLARQSGLCGCFSVRFESCVHCWREL